MVGGIHLIGGYSISPYLAARVFEAVKEIADQNVNRELSHLEDGDCGLCRSAGVEEGGHDAARADRPVREWAA